MRAVFFWEAAGLSLTKANPYAGLLAQALAAEGVELVAGHAHQFTPDWLRANQGQVDVLHLNWPNIMYEDGDLAASVAKAEAFATNLLLARRLGYRIVWTVHNLYPHDSTQYELDRLMRLVITQLADALIVHCAHAREQVATHFQRTEGVHLIPHGHFMDAYPNQTSRAEARAALGLTDETFVYFFFGNVRRYKGLEQLLEVFSSLPGDHLRLLLAAKVYNEYGERFVEQAARADPRLILRTSRFFANEEFQHLFNAGDVGVFPFTSVLTSGSVITALSFGLPVIVPAVGCLPELVPTEAGIVYDSEQSDGLRQAMSGAQRWSGAAKRAAALEVARSLDWRGIATKTLLAYGYV